MNFVHEIFHGQNVKTHSEVHPVLPAVRLKSPSVQETDDSQLGNFQMGSTRSIFAEGTADQRRSTMKSRQSTASKRMSRFYDRKPSLFQMLPEMMAKNKEGTLDDPAEPRLISASDTSRKSSTASRGSSSRP